MHLARGSARFALLVIAATTTACGSSPSSSTPKVDAGETGFGDTEGSPGQPGFPGQDGAQPPVPTLAVESIIADLTGPFAPAESARRAVIGEAIAKTDADVVCVSEVWSEADAQNIIEAAKSRLPFVARVPTDMDTLPTDPRDQSGKLPTDPTTPPCGASDLANLRALDACLVASCATKPGDPTSPLRDDPADCISKNCTSQASPVLFGPDPRCWDCAIDAWFSRVGPATYETTCSTDTRRPFAFAGANGVLVLSKLPIGSKELEVLPATDYRGSVLRVPVMATRVVDVYCADVNGFIASQERPYTGPYGGGATTSPAQWDAQFTFEAQRIAAFIQRRSGAVGRPAILAGMLGFSFDTTGGATLQRGLDAYHALTPSLTLTPATSASCTTCLDNPLDATASTGWSNVFFQLTSNPLPVVAADVTHREPIATWNGKMVPISPEYGYRVTFALSN